jgi:hypothetical protein
VRDVVDGGKALIAGRRTATLKVSGFRGQVSDA